MRNCSRPVCSLLSLSLLALGGCATLEEDGGRDFEPTLARRSRGAEAHARRDLRAGHDVALWNNVTARNVGDTLTIRLAESTNAAKSSTHHDQQVDDGDAHRARRSPAGR